MGFFPKSWGCYPPEYNPEVHGPYYPHRYYGKPDTPFSEVKLKDLKAWFGRREKSYNALRGAISRAYWRHAVTWLDVKKPGFAGIFQLVCLSGLFSFYTHYSEFKKHRMYRYH